MWYSIAVASLGENDADLQPHGVEYVCAGANLSRNLDCSVSGHYIEWKIAAGTNLPNTLQVVNVNPTSMNEVAVATLISESSDSILSTLVTYGKPEHIPLSIYCASSEQRSAYYELKYKGENRSPMMCGLIIYIRLFLLELPDPPTNLTLVNNEDMSSSYTLHWQSSSRKSRSADNYTVTITDSSSPSPPQTSITSDSSLSAVDLSHSINYTVSVRATNCAGDSAKNTMYFTSNDGGEKNIFFFCKPNFNLVKCNLIANHIV